MNTAQKPIKVRSVVLGKQYMNNTRAHRALTTKSIGFPDNIQELNIKLSLDNRKGIKTVFLNLSKDDYVELTRPLSPLDGAILDTIYSISAAGYQIFTIEQVARAFTGNTKKQVTPKLVKKIAESIDILRRVDIKIYGDTELDEKTKKKNKFVGYLLPVEYIEETAYAANGKITKNTTYRMRGGTPALYEYAEAKGQLIQVDMSLLDTSDTKSSDTLEYTLIKRYILKRIQQIKAKNSLGSNKISLAWEDKDGSGGLLQELGYKPDDFSDWNKKRHDLCQNIKDVLNYYKFTDEISGYKTYNIPGKKTVQGFEIFY